MKFAKKILSLLTVVAMLSTSVVAFAADNIDPSGNETVTSKWISAEVAAASKANGGYNIKGPVKGGVSFDITNAPHTITGFLINVEIPTGYQVRVVDPEDEESYLHNPITDSNIGKIIKGNVDFNLIQNASIIGNGWVEYSFQSTNEFTPGEDCFRFFVWDSTGNATFPAEAFKIKKLEISYGYTAITMANKEVKVVNWFDSTGPVVEEYSPVDNSATGGTNFAEKAEGRKVWNVTVDATKFTTSNVWAVISCEGDADTIEKRLTLDFDAGETDLSFNLYTNVLKEDTDASKLSLAIEYRD